MTIQCITCRELSLRDSPKHSNNGMGRCKLNPVKSEFTTIEYKRECATYIRATEATLIKRAAWREQIGIFK